MAVVDPKIANIEMYRDLQKKFPQFRSHTSKDTLKMFTERGYESTANYDPAVLNEFFQLSLRVYLDKIDISTASDALAMGGFGEQSDQERGGYLQRIAMHAITPVNPAYRNLEKGKSPDPFAVRKVEVEERFWKQNFDYQSGITVPDEYAMKDIFISEYGINDFMTGMMQALDTGYTIQLFENKLEALNAGINSQNHPLQIDTQIRTIPISDYESPTTQEFMKLINTMKDVYDALKLPPQSSAFNSLKFKTMQEPDRLKMLIRPGWKNSISTGVWSSAFNKNELAFPLDPIEIPHFGGLQAFKDYDKTTDTYSNPLFPVYDSDFGNVLGFAESEGQSTPTVATDAVEWKDPNVDVIAIIADKGFLFNKIQNPYRVEPIRNPRGLYTNYWASSPNNLVGVDHIKNCVVIKRVKTGV